MLHTSALNRTGHNSNPKLDLGIKSLVCTFIIVPPSFQSNAAVMLRSCCECFLTDVVLIGSNVCIFYFFLFLFFFQTQVVPLTGRATACEVSSAYFSGQVMFLGSQLFSLSLTDTLCDLFTLKKTASAQC